MNQNKSVFHAPTPLGLINAQEAVCAHDLSREDTILILVRYRSSSSDEIFSKINNILDECLWGEIIYLDVKGLKKWQGKTRIVQAWLLARTLGPVKHLFLAHNDTSLTLAFIKFLSYEALTMFDDGAATLILESVDIKKRELKLWERLLFFQRPKKYSLFTCFDICDDSAERVIMNNTYALLHSNSASVPSADECIIFGQPLVELGFLSEDIYIQKVCKYVMHISKKTKNINYVPHYFECPERVRLLESRLKIKVKSLPLSPECFYTVEGSSPPRYVASFVSTCLFTLPLLLKTKIDYTALHISDHIEDQEIKARFECCYDELERQGLAEIDKD